MSAPQKDGRLAPPMSPVASKATTPKTQAPFHSSFVGGQHTQNFVKLEGGPWTHERSKQLREEQQAKRLSASAESTAPYPQVLPEPQSEQNESRWRRTLGKLKRQQKAASSNVEVVSETSSRQTTPNSEDTTPSTPAQNAETAAASQITSTDKERQDSKVKDEASNSSSPLGSFRSLKNRFTSRKPAVETP